MQYIRESKIDVVLNTTAGMGGDLTLGPTDQPLPPSEEGTDMAGAKERLAHVKELLPEICTLDCGTMNFGEGDYIMVNTPAMLQAWSMPRPKLEGIGERGGAPDEMTYDNPLIALNDAGYVGTLATNSELEFVRYLRPGDHLHLTTEIESISDRKKTSLGQGYFLTWITTYRTQDDEVVGRQLFRVFKFDPATIGGQS